MLPTGSSEIWSAVYPLLPHLSPAALKHSPMVDVIISLSEQSAVYALPPEGEYVSLITVAQLVRVRIDKIDRAKTVNFFT